MANYSRTNHFTDVIDTPPEIDVSLLSQPSPLSDVTDHLPTSSFCYITCNKTVQCSLVFHIADTYRRNPVVSFSFAVRCPIIGRFLFWAQLHFYSYAASLRTILILWCLNMIIMTAENSQYAIPILGPYFELIFCRHQWTKGCVYPLSILSCSVRN